VHPTLTRNGLWIVITAGSLSMAGVVTVHPALVLCGVIVLAVVLAAWIHAWKAAGAVRRHLIRVALWPGHPTTHRGALVPDLDLPLHVVIRNASVYDVGQVELHPILSDGLTATNGLLLQIFAGSTVETHLRIKTLAVGTWFIHGLSMTLRGTLFTHQAYFPSPTPLRVLPKSSVQAQVVASNVMGSPDLDVRPRRLRSPGPGGDLREIRQYHPGDPFKRIAWKATARTGRLMLRDLEDSSSSTFYLLLDISPSMRDGPPGFAKLDHGIDWVSWYAAQAIRSGFRVGYMSVDHAVYQHLGPDEGRKQLMRITELLAGLHSVVEEGYVDATLPELIDALAEYLRFQKGLDCRVVVAADPLDPALVAGATGRLYSRAILESWMERCRNQQIKRSARAAWTVPGPGRIPSPSRQAKIKAEGGRDPRPMSPAPKSEISVERIKDASQDRTSYPPTITSFLEREIRQCCRTVGIALPYRTALLPDAKTQGVTSALRILATRRPAMSVIFVSDLMGIEMNRNLDNAIRHLQSRGHHLTVVSPYAPNLWAPNGPKQSILHRVFSEHEKEEMTATWIHLARLGIRTVVSPRRTSRQPSGYPLDVPSRRASQRMAE